MAAGIHRVPTVRPPARAATLFIPRMTPRWAVLVILPVERVTGEKKSEMSQKGTGAGAQGMSLPTRQHCPVCGASPASQASHPLSQHALSWRTTDFGIRSSPAWRLSPAGPRVQCQPNPVRHSAGLPRHLPRPPRGISARSPGLDLRVARTEWPQDRPCASPLLNRGSSHWWGCSRLIPPAACY